jgi:large subunit ribosomal protein L9
MPEAILLKDVDNLGHKGSLVVVSKGYLRNYLLPRKLAQAATASSIAAAEIAYAAAAAERAQAANDSQELADLLSATTLTITAPAGEDGRLFGSVTPQDIADAILEARAVEIDKRKIHLAAPIKEVGSHSVEIDLAVGIKATVTTIVAEQ